jgi:hypothetical protein
VDGNDADACLVVAAVARSEADSPSCLLCDQYLCTYEKGKKVKVRSEAVVTYSEGEIMVPVVLHSFLRSDSVLAPVHLDEGVALVLVDNASLNLAVPTEDLP